jgi:hypothetical protein
MAVLDVDSLAAARPWYAGRGLDLDAILRQGCRWHRGHPDKQKALFRIPESVSVLFTVSRNKDGFELRSMSRTGGSSQDMIPPSKHPNGATLEWLDDPTKVPEMPRELVTLWLELQTRPERGERKPMGVGRRDLEELLERIDPSELSYDEWIFCGMALHHETGGAPDGLELWDSWSSRSPKYQEHYQEEKYASFCSNVPNPRTIATLRRMADADMASEFRPIAPLPEAHRPAPRFEFIRAHDFANRPYEPMDIHGVEPHGAILGLTIGAWGTGKSAFVLDKVLHQAAGIDYRGRKTKRKSTAIIAAEGAYGVAHRLRAQAQALGLILADLPIWVLPASPNFYQTADAPEIARALDAVGGVDQVIADTFARVSIGGEENSSKDVGIVVQRFQWLTDRNCAMVNATHHEGKDSSKGARGSSALSAAADFIHVISRSGEHRQMTVAKMKDGPDGGVFPFRLVPAILGLNPDGTEQSAVTVEHVEDRKPVIPRVGANEKLLQQTAHEHFLLYKKRTTENELIRLATKAHPNEPDGQRFVVAKNLRRALLKCYEKGILRLVDGLVVEVDHGTR